MELKSAICKIRKARVEFEYELTEFIAEKVKEFQEKNGARISYVNVGLVDASTLQEKKNLVAGVTVELDI